MNVLMVTQRLDMDDDVLGFVHGFIKCLSNKVAGLGIICLEQGRTDLPAKVKIFSMGKEQGRGRLGRFINYQRAMAHLAPKAQVIFGHMNPVYTILAAPWAKLFRRKMVMWYAHGYVGNRLKLAHWLADSVVTATSAGFRIPSHKVRVIGQCIDTNRFYPSPQKRPKGCFKLLSLGRISPVTDRR
jgi:glycosyltransferase involved in cell wall biosynthesis